MSAVSQVKPVAFNVEVPETEAEADIVRLVFDPDIRLLHNNSGNCTVVKNDVKDPLGIGSRIDADQALIRAVGLLGDFGPDIRGAAVVHFNVLELKMEHRSLRGGLIEYLRELQQER